MKMPENRRLQMLKLKTCREQSAFATGYDSGYIDGVVHAYEVQTEAEWLLKKLKKGGEKIGTKKREKGKVKRPHAKSER